MPATVHGILNSALRRAEPYTINDNNPGHKTKNHINHRRAHIRLVARHRANTTAPLIVGNKFIDINIQTPLFIEIIL